MRGLALVRPGGTSYQFVGHGSVGEPDLRLLRGRRARLFKIPKHELARLRFDAGASYLLVVLDVERAKLDLDDRLMQAQTARATALVALCQGIFGLAKSDTANPLPSAKP